MTAMALHSSDEMSPAMRGAALTSIIFHAIVITLGLMGLPYLRTPPPMLEDAISVEILDIADIRQTNKPPVKAPPKPEPEKKEVPPEKKVDKPPMPPKVDIKEPPKAVPPKPPEPKKEITKKPEPKIPPPPSEKLKEPEPKPEPPKEDVKEEVQQQEDFASLLKNLQDSEPQPDVAAVNPDAEVPPEPSPLAKFSQQLTMSEADALRHQLSQCWSIQAGARYAEDLVVEIKLTVNPDRTVSSATIVNQGRYNQDGFFRAAADSAMRAVRSPMCNPLNLPAEKYHVWKDIVAVFDPRDML
jgi:hypothetical protein